ncbi:hypothetical protein GCM10010145_06140 [Streptomyces ruber]|uniref:Uncharacterized protein n=2 Tax=Streptomyces TaxID=1883 RepID=A0A918B7G3_9ACTN|nr:hypothetical protein GCM10010145_06140 [Streptomyces ruber]
MVLLIVLTALPVHLLLLAGAQALASALMLVAGVAVVRHARGGLCEECVAGMPLNASELADRRRPLLRAVHRLDSRSAFVLYCALVCVPPAAVLLTEPGGIAHRFSSEAGLLLTLLTYVSTLTHARYAPWCPYCDEGQEDDDTAPAAVPPAPRTV